MDKSVRSWHGVAVATLARARAGQDERLSELEGRSGERERATADCKGAVLALLEEVTAINDEIATLNLKVPNPRFKRHKIDAEREAARLEAGSE